MRKSIAILCCLAFSGCNTSDSSSVDTASGSETGAASAVGPSSSGVGTDSLLSGIDLAGLQTDQAEDTNAQSESTGPFVDIASEIGVNFV